MPSFLEIQQADVAQQIDVKTHSILSWLSGDALNKRMGISLDQPLSMNLVQRGISWGEKEVNDLIGTLFGRMMEASAEVEEIQNRLKARLPLYNDDAARQPHLQGLAVQQQKSDVPNENGNKKKNQTNRRNHHHVSVLDGQQRSFSLTTVVAWILARGGRMADPGDTPPPELLAAVTVESKNGVRRPRFDFDQTESVPWEHHGQALGPMGHLLSPLFDPGVSWNTAALFMNSQLDQALAEAAAHSPQARLIRSVFQAMDHLLDRLQEQNQRMSPREIMGVLVSSLAQSSINVGILHEDVDPDLFFRNSNGRSKALTQTDHIRPILITGAGGSNSPEGGEVGAFTHKGQIRASQLSDAPSFQYVFKTAYAAAIDAANCTYAAGGSIQGGERAIADCLHTILNQFHSDPDGKEKTKALAHQIGKRLEGCVEATALLTNAKLDPQQSKITSIEDPELITLMQSYASTGLRALTSVVATMAATHADQAKRVLKMVNHTYAENRLVGELLSVAEGKPRQERWNTQRLDWAVKTWSQTLPRKKITPEQATLGLLERIANGGVREAGYVQTDPKDLKRLVEKLKNPKAGARVLNSSVMTGPPHNRRPSKELTATLAIALSITKEDLEAGVHLMAGTIDLGVMQGAKAKARTTPAQTIDLADDRIGQRLLKRRRQVWAEMADVNFSAAGFVPMTEFWRLENRLEERAGDIKNMLAGDRAISNSTAQSYESEYRSLARVMDTRAWNQVVQNTKLAHLLYRHKFHEMDEATRRQQWPKLRNGATEERVKPVVIAAERTKRSSQGDLKRGDLKRSPSTYGRRR